MVDEALAGRVPIRQCRSAAEACRVLEGRGPGSAVVLTSVPDATAAAGRRVQHLVRAVSPVPVVAVVGSGDVAAAATALAFGARDYVVRHFSPHQIERVLCLASASGKAPEHARLTDRLWRSIVSRVTDAVFVVPPDGRLQPLTPAAVSVFPDRRPPTSFAEIVRLVHPEDRTAAMAAFAAWRRGEDVELAVRMAGPDGWRRFSSVGFDLQGDPAVGGVVVTARDVTAAWEAKELALRQAGTDPITGLAARRRFAEAVATAAEDGRQPVLVLLDLDGLGLVNEQFGHDAGDELLVTTARRIEQCLPPTALAGRVGGDEFGVLFRDPDAGTSAEALARALVDAVAGSGPTDELSTGAGPVGPPGRSGPVAQASAGVAVGDSGTARQLLADAGLALDLANRRGPGTVVLFDQALRQRTVERRRLHSDLRGAAIRGELELVFQPVLSLPHDRLAGFEALVRWRHPELGLLPPDRFVPLAEQSGDILDVDSWVLRQACTQLGTWTRQRPDLPIGMAVNVSARQLMDPGFAASVTAVLDTVGIVPAHLCLEVTERAVVDDLDAAAAALRLLRTTGVRVAIDDFGVGFSSMVYLQRFPADHIKIDRSFIAGLGTDPVDTILVQTILDLATRLGMEAVAEGVETASQRDELVRSGCPFGQGYWWDRPLSPAQATALVLRAPEPEGWASPWIAPGYPPPGADAPPTAPAGSGAGQRKRSRSPVRDHGAGEPSPVPLAPAVTVARSPAMAPEHAVTSFLGHELRTPLHVISSYAELLRCDLTGDRQGDLTDSRPGAEELADRARSAVDAIERQVGHIERIVGSLRDARAVEEGAVVLRRAPVDVPAAIRSLLADLGAELGDHPVRLHHDGEPVVVDADHGRLVQILTNVLVNAAKFSPPGTAIDVTVATCDDDAQVTVVDRGPGIPLPAVRDAFRRFVTLDRARGGSGLGLFLARGFSQAHGGDLTYRRAHTGGAELVLRLPRGCSADAAGTSGTPRRLTVSSVAALSHHAVTRPSAGGAVATGTTPADRVPALLALPLAGPVGRDAEALRVLAGAQQAMAAVATRADASAILAEVVEELGGRVPVGGPAGPDEVVPVDLSLGDPPVRYAAAEPLSAARVRLEAVLPILVDLAHVVLSKERSRVR